MFPYQKWPHNKLKPMDVLWERQDSIDFPFLRGQNFLLTIFQPFLFWGFRPSMGRFWRGKIWSKVFLQNFFRGNTFTTTKIGYYWRCLSDRYLYVQYVGSSPESSQSSREELSSRGAIKPIPLRGIIRQFIILLASCPDSPDDIVQCSQYYIAPNFDFDLRRGYIWCSVNVRSFMKRRIVGRCFMLTSSTTLLQNSSTSLRQRFVFYFSLFNQLRLFSILILYSIVYYRIVYYRILQNSLIQNSLRWNSVVYNSLLQHSLLFAFPFLYAVVFSPSVYPLTDGAINCSF